MDSYLFLVNLAGVQEFIEQSRKLADLGQSSKLIGQVMKEVMGFLKAQEATFIIPAQISPTSIESPPNRLLFEIEKCDDPDQVVRNVKKTVGGTLKCIGERAYEKIAGSISAPERKAKLKKVWDTAWEDPWPIFVERQPLCDDFVEAHSQLSQKLARSKLTREFPQLPSHPAKAGVEKCVQCGRRDVWGPGIFRDNRDFWGLENSKPDACISELRKNLRVSPSERLCPVCLGKRLLGMQDASWPSTTEVALKPFVKSIEQTVETKPCEILPILGSLGCNLRKLPDVRLLEMEWWKQKPEWLLEETLRPNRFADEVGDLSDRVRCLLKSPDPDVRKVIKRLLESPVRNAGKIAKLLLEEHEKIVSRIKEKQRDLYKEVYGEVGKKPCTYLSVLCFDGDEMGKFIGGLDRSEIKLFSKALSALAGEMKSIVEDHNGTPVYSGGDDLLALLPLEDTLKAANEIRTTFRDGFPEELRKKLREMPGGKEHFSGSAGMVAFPHHFPMSQALSQARICLEEAKDEYDRNALVVGFMLPDGSIRKAGFKWEMPNHCHHPLTAWFTDILSARQKGPREKGFGRGLIYDLVQELEAYYTKDSGTNWDFVLKDAYREALEWEIGRLLQRHSGDNAQADWIAPLVNGLASGVEKHDPGQHRYCLKECYGPENVIGWLRLADLWARKE